MELILVAAVAAGASLLTFFSGFGLGTLLLPVFALSVPVEAAVMMTAVVHLANNLFKLGLIYRHIDRAIVVQFGLPALVAAWWGAGLLLDLSLRPPLTHYSLWDQPFEVSWTGLIVGALIIVFALTDLVRADQRTGIPKKWLPAGGLFSGFFGGLSGHQGAMRSAFLIGCGLGKTRFVATGVAIACLVDLSRLSRYLPSWPVLVDSAPLDLMITAILAAFAGAWVGRSLLHKITLKRFHLTVGGILILAGLAMMAGWS